MIRIYKLERRYVGKDCVQLMFSIGKKLRILKGSKVIFNYNSKGENDFSEYTNEYIKDDRRFQFPYPNIHIHNKMFGLKYKKLVNQLLDYDIVYSLIDTPDLGDSEDSKNDFSNVLYYKVLKDGEEAFVIVSSSKFNPVFNMDVEALKQFHIYKVKEPLISKIFGEGISDMDFNVAKNFVRKRKYRR